ncbi:MAG: c-type cytochrome [Clostridia bacterium]|nr:c-type cytochrome [Clostridia bacterium]
MVNTKKWHVLLCALLLIALVVASTMLITSCNDDDETTPDPKVTTDAPGTTTKDNGGEPVTPTTTVDLGNYDRVDTNGENVGATASSGVVGDMSMYTSPNGIVTLGDSLYVSDETGKAIYKLSLTGEVQKKYTSTKTVNRVVTDGTNVYSLEGGLDGTVVKLSADLSVVTSVAVGHTPHDMAVVGTKGYVLNRFANTVSVVTLGDMKVSSTIAIEGREPTAAVTVGNKVYVACHLPDEATSATTMSANVAIISSTTDKVEKTIDLINGASGVKGICVSPDGSRVYVAHVIGRYTYPTTQLDRGWINTNGFTIIETDKEEALCSVLLDEVDLGAANPWGIKVSADGKYLCVALSGLNEIMIVNISKMNQKITRVQNKQSTRVVETLADIADYLPFLNSCRERITVGVGVRNIVEKDGVLYCANYFDGTVSAVTLSNYSVKTLSFVKQPEASAVRQGQILWSDANMCYQKWESCNSCHPDGIVDGFNWDNLNDGLGGGGKSAKSMLYSHRTPPVMITGIRPNAEAATAAGMKFIQFNTLPSEDIAKIDEYLKSLYPVQSPALNKDGTLTESATSGKALFEKNCASCHPAPLYTDLKLHNVNSNKFSGDNGEYDTPTLVEVWRTGPYMHDGSLKTIEEVVKFFAKDLNDADVKKLADYVRSIGDEGEDYGLEQAIGTYNGALHYNKYANGATLEKLVVRKQADDAAKSVVVALTVYDKNGKQVAYADVGITDVAVNSSMVITLKKAITLPEGGSYTVAFYDTETGKPVASTYTAK